MMPLGVLHIVRNSVINDARVIKEIDTLSEHFEGLEFTAIGYSREKGNEFRYRKNVFVIQIGPRFNTTSVFRKILNYFSWVISAVKLGKSLEILIVHCHDIDALLVGVILKISGRCRLIFDAHELQSEQWDEAQKPFFKKKFIRLGELAMLRYVDHLITVSQSILDWYKERHPHINSTLLRNIPNIVDRKHTYALRDYFNIPRNDIVFIYLGVLDVSRGLRSILDCFVSGDIKHHIVFMGSGEFEAEIVKAERLHDNVHYHPPVPPNEVVSVTASADIGLCMYPGNCLNNEYCMPNKVFEYITSGLPVVASNLTEIKLLLAKYQAGWVVDDDASLKEFLITINAEILTNISLKLKERTKDLSWGNEALGLINAYGMILDSDK